MRFHALDGLRGLAAYIVVIAHFQLMTGVGHSIAPKGTGQFGVMLFFVLSGFLMGVLYASREFTRANLLDFYQKRIARVVPLYFLTVLFCFVVTTGELGLKVYTVDWSNLAEHLLFWRGEHVLWTIAVEVQFYACFPLVWLLYRRFGRVGSAYLLLVIAGIYFLEFPKLPPVLMYLPFFLLGIIVAEIPKPSSGYGSIFFVLAFVCFLLSLPGPRIYLMGTAGDVWKDPLNMIVIPVFLLSCIHCRLANRMLGNPVGNFLGKISYSVYLTHLIVIWALREHGLIEKNIGGLILALCAVTFVSWISYLSIESPARKWITRIGRKGATAAPPQH